MATKQKRLTATEALRQAIAESGMNFLQLEKHTGVLRQSLMKFVRGEQSLRLDVADKLMEALGVRVELGPIRTSGTSRKPRSKATDRQACKNDCKAGKAG